MAFKKQNEEENVVEEVKEQNLQNEGEKPVASKKPKKEEGTRLS